MSKREIPQLVTDLQAIRDRLTPKEMWMQNGYGRTEGPNCLMGAIFMVTDIMKGSILIAPPVTDRLKLVENSLRDVIKESTPFSGGVISFNDAHTHKEVLEVIDRALESERKKAGIVEYAEC